MLTSKRKTNALPKKQYFGTDGIRGKFGEGAMHPEFVLKLGWALGTVLAGAKDSTVLIGKDTRISGYLMESALEAGLSAAGVNIKLLGPMPTPAISYLTSTLRAQAGIVISASHNPFHDNGIKCFSQDGTKLGDDIELAIEAALHKPLTTVESAALGKASRLDDAPARYMEFCKSVVPKHIDFKGLKVVLDCANGATYHIAPKLFEELGATVMTLGTEPDGLNINKDCGSTATKALSAAVLENKADVGIAFDGDGDRVIFIDHKGARINGDQLLYVIAQYAKSHNLIHGGVVGTQMSNLGLEQAIHGLDLDFVRADVGDRYVLAELNKHGWQLGGESSGHIINFNYIPTGDGIISALQILTVMCAKDKTLNQLLSGLLIYPQVMINIPLTKRNVALDKPEIAKAVADVEAILGNRGRVLLRASGTEPLIRVMIESEDPIQTQALAEQLAKQIKPFV